MKMKRIIAFVVATILVLLLAFGYFEFYGYPITKYIAKKEITAYIKDNFLDLEYTTSNVTFNFKDDSYYISVDVVNSEDNDFNVSYLNGKVSDDYTWRVIERENTASRLQIHLNEEKYDQPAQDIFKDNYHFSLLTYNHEAFKNNLPKLDMEIEAMLQEYPLEIHIYLNDKVKYTVDKKASLKQEITEAYQKIGILLSQITID